MKKAMLVLVSAISYLSAVTIVPYYVNVNYSKDTNKKNADIFGVYLSKYKNSYKFELDYEYLQLNYKDSPEYIQNDLTFLLNYFFKQHYKISLGIHNIFSSNPETITKYKPSTNPMLPSTTITETVYKNSYDYVFAASFNYYEYLKYDYGSDFFYSVYDNTDVYQITPFYGISFGNYYSKIGSFYAKAKVNLIKITKNVTPKSFYVNYDFQLKNYNKSWTTSLDVSFGKSAYKVSKSGFVVYNLGEEYKNSYSLSVSKAITPKDSISGSISCTQFEETKGYEASSTAVLFTYTRMF